MLLTLLISAILSLEADFVQTKTVALMAEPQVSTGHMTYRAPDYMQWAYLTPQNMVWEVDGNNSNVNPQVQRLLRMIMAAIAGEGEVDAKAQKESRKLFQSVNVVMDESGRVAQRVELVEKNGDTTLIEFTNVVTVHVYEVRALVHDPF